MFFRNLMAVVAEWNSVEFGQADEQIAELSLEQAACVAIPRAAGTLLTDPNLDQIQYRRL